MNRKMVIKTYLLGIKDGHNGCGNDYTRIFTCSTNSMAYYEKKRRMIAEEFKKMYNHDAVYAITNYTRQMCEMEPSVFDEHIQKVGLRVA